jgi:hypothetical protein
MVVTEERAALRFSRSATTSRWLGELVASPEVPRQGMATIKTYRSLQGQAAVVAHT